MQQSSLTTCNLVRFGIFRIAIAAWLALVLLGTTSCAGSNGSAPASNPDVMPTSMPDPTPTPPTTPMTAPTTTPPPTPIPTDCPRSSSEGIEYQLTFTAAWTATTHPTNFPTGSNTHFTTLVGGVHSSDHSFWQRGGTATQGIENMAETGATGTLRDEVNAAVKARAYVGTGGISNAGMTTLRFRVNQACPLVTFTSMLAPSHDWFIGVSSIDLRDNNGEFLDRMPVNLRVYDAGTEDGEDFSLNGTDTTPQAMITRLTTDASATDFADGIHRSSGVFIGQFVFEKVTSTSLALPQDAAPQDRADRILLSEALLTIADHGMGKVTDRIQQAKAGTGRRFSVGGQSSLSALLAAAQSQSVATGTVSLKGALNGSAFALPVTGDSNDGFSGRTTLWGEGDYQRLAGSVDAMRWRGTLFSTYTGVDIQLSNRVLGGLMVSWNQGDFSYNSTDLHNEYALNLISIHPWLNWTILNGRMDLWATVGHGQGVLEINHPGGLEQSKEDIKTQTFGAGVSSLIWQTNASTIHLKGELSRADMNTKDSSKTPATEVQRVQIAVVGSHTHRSLAGARFVPTLELGIRHDNAYGQASNKVEMSGELSYTKGGITLTGWGRAVLAPDNDRWSLGSTLSLDPGAVGRGLYFSFAPNWGGATEDVSEPWLQRNLHETAKKTDQTADVLMDIQLGYRIQSGKKWHITPYSILSFADGVTSLYRIGGQINIFDRSLLSLESRWQEPTVTTEAGHSIRLNIQFDW